MSCRCWRRSWLGWRRVSSRCSPPAPRLTGTSRALRWSSRPAHGAATGRRQEVRHLGPQRRREREHRRHGEVLTAGVDELHVPAADAEAFSLPALRAETASTHSKLDILDDEQGFRKPPVKDTPCRSLPPMARTKRGHDAK